MSYPRVAQAHSVKGSAFTQIVPSGGRWPKPSYRRLEVLTEGWLSVLALGEASCRFLNIANVFEWWMPMYSARIISSLATKAVASWFVGVHEQIPARESTQRARVHGNTLDDDQTTELYLGLNEMLIKSDGNVTE